MARATKEEVLLLHISLNDRQGENSMTLFVAKRQIHPAGIGEDSDDFQWSSSKVSGIMERGISQRILLRLNLVKSSIRSINFNVSTT